MLVVGAGSAASGFAPRPRFGRYPCHARVDPLGIRDQPVRVGRVGWQEIVGRAMDRDVEGVEVGVHRGLSVAGAVRAGDFDPPAQTPGSTTMSVESTISGLADRMLREAPCRALRGPQPEGLPMDVMDAIRRRRAVRVYTDRPVPDEVVDRLLRMALSAPTGSGSQAWSLMVVRDEGRRREIADLVIAGGARYFEAMRPRRDGTSPEEHRRQCEEYSETILSTYRVAPVWIIGLLVPRGNYPESMREGGHIDDLLSVGFAMENLFVAARAEGLGTVPTTAFQRFEKERLQGILGLPAEVDPVIVTPLGFPPSFPEGLPPALKRSFRNWRALVHDEQWGGARG